MKKKKDSIAMDLSVSGPKGHSSIAGVMLNTSQHFMIAGKMVSLRNLIK